MLIILIFRDIKKSFIDKYILLKIGKVHLTYDGCFLSAFYCFSHSIKSRDWFMPIFCYTIKTNAGNAKYIWFISLQSIVLKSNVFYQFFANKADTWIYYNLLT